MRPVVGIDEMRALDEQALTDVGYEELVHRAGSAVATQAIAMLDGVAGKRVAVVAGRGSNGEDGRVAARALVARGASVLVLPPDADAAALEGCELIIDAAYGTGLARAYEAPEVPPGATVLAVDLPSGLDGDTGVRKGRPMPASATVTMAATKAGLLLGHGPELCGDVVVADIGIETASASMALLEDADVSLIPARRRSDHKWSTAVVVLAGSPGMEGAAALSCLGALHAGAGMVHLVSSGDSQRIPLEVVIRPAELDDLARVVREDEARCGALVVGPGLGRGPAVRRAVTEVLAQRSTPVVLDADGLAAIESVEELADLVGAAPAPVVITPHNGELARLLDAELTDDRVGQLRGLVEATGATVLSKGPTTVVVGPSDRSHEVLFVTSGTEALATAGTGDVLSGVIGALVARGMDATLAAAVGAHVHGRAGASAPGSLVASALPQLIGEVLKEVRHGR
jgi:NAD(P)H-hydrate epimerase